ncbi:MAG: sterol desaturase family protein [Betaproteobacteria bacterium]
MSPVLAILITVGFVIVTTLISQKWSIVHYAFDASWYRRLSILTLLCYAALAVFSVTLGAWLDLTACYPPLALFFNTLPPWLNGLIGYLIVTFFNYWWHRLRHHHDGLWKAFHQIHHSTYRLESLTSIYAHPTDFLSTLVVINITCYVLLGFNAESCIWAGLMVNLFEIWEHSNIPTPVWLGYIIVRPEMHRIHHEYHQHTNNYGFPLWDMIFGTYENSTRLVQCGFDAAEEKKLLPMLLFKKVTD